MKTAYYHLPGLFEFFDFYRVFLPVYTEHREYFYDNAVIASVYGAPSGCIWGGGRFGGEADAREVFSLMESCGISSRLTFSNSLLREEHLSDSLCNDLCRLFSEGNSGVIVHSDLLAGYLREKYPKLYLVSSTTKVLTRFDELLAELEREEFRYVVPDFRLNKQYSQLAALPRKLKDKTEFLCNECCRAECTDRKACYENVSRRILGEDCPEHICRAKGGSNGYLFSAAMKSPLFISREDIRTKYLPLGFSNFKIEGRGLGSALLLEMLLYYLVKSEYQLAVREMMYLDSMLDLF